LTHAQFTAAIAWDRAKRAVLVKKAGIQFDGCACPVGKQARDLSATPALLQCGIFAVPISS
jgi:hypothetical protein